MQIELSLSISVRGAAENAAVEDVVARASIPIPVANTWQVIDPAAAAMTL